jgi:hypothetical protein
MSAFDPFQTFAAVLGDESWPPADGEARLRGRRVNANEPHREVRDPRHRGCTSLAFHPKYTFAFTGRNPRDFRTTAAAP